MSNFNQFSCLDCHAGLRCDFDVLNEHYLMHRTNIICPFCENTRIFTDKQSFNIHLTKDHHQKVIRRKSCRYCEEVFPNEELWNKHIELEHKDMRNKHRSLVSNGRILCDVVGCEFKTNSEIFLQKHQRVCHGKTEPDMINIRTISNIEVKLESSLEPLAGKPYRKPGRPRLCGNSELHDLSTALVEYVRKPRGRKRKIIEEVDQSIDSSSTKKERKLGRPKKITLDKKVIEEVIPELDHIIKIEETMDIFYA